MVVGDFIMNEADILRLAVLKEVPTELPTQLVVQTTEIKSPLPA